MKPTIKERLYNAFAAAGRPITTAVIAERLGLPLRQARSGVSCLIREGGLEPVAVVERTTWTYAATPGWQLASKPAPIVRTCDALLDAWPAPINPSVLAGQARRVDRGWSADA